MEDYNRFMNENENRRKYREAFFTQLVYQQMEREIDLLTLSPFRSIPLCLEKKSKAVSGYSEQIYSAIPTNDTGNIL